MDISTEFLHEDGKWEKCMILNVHGDRVSIRIDGGYKRTISLEQLRPRTKELLIDKDSIKYTFNGIDYELTPHALERFCTRFVDTNPELTISQSLRRGNFVKIQPKTGRVYELLKHGSNCQILFNQDKNIVFILDPINKLILTIYKYSTSKYKINSSKYSKVAVKNRGR